ncbi:MAG: chlororespiratory reduction protein 7 [Elainellaceae cyanobacterium]
MSDPRMYQEDAFVLLESGQDEQFLAPDEMLEKLKAVLGQHPDSLPRDAQQFSDLEDQARCVLHTSCELSVAPGQYLQWYAVRLEK